MPTLTQPASDHMERVVLGASMLYPDALSDALALEAADFFLGSHQAIYRAMQSLYSEGKHVDSSTVREKLLARRELDSVGGFSYVLSLEEGIPHDFNVESYCKVLKSKRQLRQLIAVGMELQERASDPSEDATTVLADAEARLAEIADAGISKGGFSRIEEIVSSLGSIDRLYQPHAVTGLRTHYTELDRMTGGLQDSDLIILAARPSMGKTALAINIAANAALWDQKSVAIFSGEMSKVSLLAKRLLPCVAQTKDRSGLNYALERLLGSNLLIDDASGITLPEARAKLRRLSHKQPLDLVIFDYLQIMGSVGKTENRTQEVTKLSQGLKALAKEFAVPVIAVSQLSRANTQRGDRRPVLSDLRESGSIEQDADLVAFIHREEYYQRDNPEFTGKAEIIVAKQRNGPTGSIGLAWLAEFTRFENLAI